MKILKAALAGTSIAVLSAVSAFAADLPSRKAPAPYIAPPPVFTWTGFYIGVNAGAAIRANSNTNSYYGYGYGSGGTSNVAFVGGGQIGYNWQMSSIVFGLEADAQYRSNLGTAGSSYYGPGNNSGFLGTARGRLGFLFAPQWLVYATGGAAFGNTFAQSGGVGSYSYASFPYGAGFGSGNTAFRVGYTVGGGVEWAFAPNWSVKAEYLFVDLGRTNQAFAVYGNQSRSQAHVARLGLNYRFNFGGVPAPVVARY